MSKSVFISNEELPSAFITALKNKNFSLVAQSMIRFKAIPFTVSATDFDWIFFTSKRSVDFFLAGCSILVNKHKIACVGKATADYLVQKGYVVDFFGDYAGEPKKVGKDFLLLLKKNRVLFPLSTRSKRSISDLVPETQKVEHIVYETTLYPREIVNNFDYLVFTSPSNSASFLLKNQIYGAQKVIAWGNSTAQFLKEKQIEVHHTLKRSSFSELSAYLLHELD